MRHLLAILILLGASHLAKATVLEVQHGWGGVDRSGRWEPVFVTAADPTPRNVILEIVAADEKGSAGVIRQRFAIGPEKRTYPLFIPVEAGTWQRTVVVLRDDQTERTLAQYPPAGAAVQPAAPFNGNLIGISGQPATLTTLDQQMKAAGLQSGYLEPRRLPRSPVGYDALDVLLLNQPHMAAMEDEQQQAIVAWVRAGGTLLFVPGGQAVPPGPLADMLPCTVGPVTAIDVSADEARAAGLDPRAARLAARALEPKPHAQAIPLFATPTASASAGRVGLGRVVVSPIDLTGLRFSDPAHLAEFWRPLLAGSIEPRATPSNAEAAAGALAATLPAHHHAFPTFATWELVLLLIMLIVGPADALVLRALGIRPWQISTACGFAGLIAVFILILIQLLVPTKPSRALLRLTDQADDQTVAETDLLAGSQFSSAPFLSSGREEWWQLLSVEASDSPPADVPFHQTSSENLPEPARLPPITLALLGRQFHSSPPLLEAALLVHRANGSTRITGSLRNLGSRPLRSVFLQTRDATIPLSSTPIPPRQSAVIDTSAAPTTQSIDPLLPVVWQSSSRRLAWLLASHQDLACIYAEMEPAASAAIDQHEWVRALVKLKNPPAE